jgi:hypothetical protein
VADPPRRPTACFWVQGREPPIIERLDQIPDGLFLDSEHRGDLGNRPALNGRQRHPGTPQPDQVLRRAGDPHQLLRLVQTKIAKKDLWLPAHATSPRAQP